ncbi:MFS transporter [Candidatus Acidianus copahuensis]|uniref:MFS transporter n=1 Tax=Candidatus Acidianus copahuensis TaxID=1160895 RepID=A0A031LM55_9CREN|nr:MFS transporter [Candidatus Acidianus copahuensis]EZQ01968.1 MFS transporter [Candidatus Acidianus copahuensis]
MEDNEIIGKVDKAKWSSIHILMSISLFVGFFMWGIIASIAPLFYPSVKNVLFLLTPTFATLVGNLILPLFSDKTLGRKTTFFITMGMYAMGTLLIGISTVLSRFNVDMLSSPPYIYLIVIGIILGVLGVEGEVPVMLSYTAEMIPLNQRDRMLVLAPNFDNVGAMIAALVGYLTYNITSSAAIELLSLVIVAILGIITAVVVRLLLPESVRWLITKGKENIAKKEVSKLKEKNNVRERTNIRQISLSKRYIFLALIGISQYVTYGLMAYVVADYYFTGAEIPLIIFVANLGASVAGFVAFFAIDKIGSRKFSLMSFFGGLVSTLAILVSILYYGQLLKPINGEIQMSEMVSSGFIFIFYTLLLINMFFSEFGWASRTVHEPTLMPTDSRAFLIGVVRVAPVVANSVSVYATSSFNLTSFIIYNAILWALGLGASSWWFYDGYDVNMVPLELTSGSTTSNG